MISGNKKAAALTAARENELHCRTYRKAATLSMTKARLLVEIRGLVQSLGNPFLSQAEKEICKILFSSTIRKMAVLQNGRYGGLGCVASKNSERPE